MDNLRKTGSIISEFDETLWHTMVENVTICEDKKWSLGLKIWIKIKLLTQLIAFLILKTPTLLCCNIFVPFYFFCI